MSKFPKSVEIQVFRGGKQTDSHGVTMDWNEGCLDKIIAGFKKVGEKVPACISLKGHPKDNLPALAWFSDFKRKGLNLFAKMDDIVPEFAEVLRKKMFKNRSLALREDFSPRHVAFLGSMPPAVKKLTDFAFKEDDKDFIEHEFSVESNEFSDFQTTSAFSMIGRIFQGIRDFKIEKDGIEKADKIISQFEIDRLKNMEPDPIAQPDFVEPNTKPGGDMPDKNFKEEYEAEVKKNSTLTADLETAKSDVTAGADFKEKFEAEKKRADGLQADIKKADSDSKEKGYNDFSEELVKNEKILPAEKASTVTMQKTLDGQEPMDFMEGDKPVKITPLEHYRKTLENKSISGLFGEKFQGATTPAESANEEISKKTSDLAAKESLTFGEANKKLRELEPGLFKGVSFSEVQKDEK